MEFTKTELGFNETDELEKLIFTSFDLYRKSLSYAIRHSIHICIWEDDTSGHHTEGLLMRCQDAAIFKRENDRFAGIKLNLLT